MSAEENKRTVQSIFEAFGRGDVPGVLQHVSEDVSWKAPGPDAVPYFGDRRGHAGAVEFFQNLGGNVDFEHFEPGAFIAEGGHVVVLGRERGRVKQTGKTFDNEWALVFGFDDGGKVTSFQCYENTAAIAEAFS
ncbi:MAG TPA: nuclear transport factor 2 family protein [Pyrinomonadaceae bacterium]|nr:nuclear transport factor 2 family protein [Pyrinomonadaceae bacterium]